MGIEFVSRRIIRERKRPEFVTITVAEAKAAGYHALTSAYSTRLFEQCEMLQKVQKDFANADTKLVRLDDKAHRIELWRK